MIAATASAQSPELERQADQYDSWQPGALGRVSGAFVWMIGRCRGQPAPVAGVAFARAQKRDLAEFNHGFEEGRRANDAYVQMLGGDAKGVRTICSLIENAYGELWQKEPRR